MATKGYQEIREWTRTAAEGDYLAEFEDGPEADPQSLCGYTEPEMADIDRRLKERDLRIDADDKGLVVARRE